MSKIVFIEGCVAAGKSSAMAHVKEKMKHWLILPEPLERFEAGQLASGGRKNYLKDFYDFPNSDNFRRLQTQIILSLLERYEKGSRAPAGTVVLYERSVEAAKVIFIEHNRRLLSDEDYTMLRDLCAFAERTFETDSVRIYLKLKDYEMAGRIKYRNRLSEEKLRLSEMFGIQKRMDRWAESRADYVIDTSGISAEKVADEIVKILS